MIEKHVKVPARSGPADADHGSMTHEQLRSIVGGEAAPAVRRGGHDHRQGPPASEGEQAINKLGRNLKRG